MQRTVIGLAALALVGLLAGCGPHPAQAAGVTMIVGQLDAGRTVQVKVGDTVRVTLTEDRPVPGSSLTWDVASSVPSVLKAGTVTRNPATMTPVGSDTYSADFLALTSGQSVLEAHGTTSCEAMAKQNCPDRAFQITVVITN